MACADVARLGEGHAESDPGFGIAWERLHGAAEVAHVLGVGAMLAAAQQAAPGEADDAGRVRAYGLRGGGCGVEKLQRLPEHGK